MVDHGTAGPRDWRLSCSLIVALVSLLTVATVARGDQGQEHWQIQQADGSAEGARYWRTSQVDRQAISGGATFGLRLQFQDAPLRWSAGLIEGLSRRSNQPLQLADLADGVIPLNHRRIATLALGVRHEDNPWTWRGDVALSRFRGAGSERLHSRETFLDGAIGLERDYQLVSGFVEARLRQVFDFLDRQALAEPLRAQAFIEEGERSSFGRTRFLLAGGFRIRDPEQRWTITVDAGWQAAGGALVFRPRLHHQLHQRLQLWLGADCRNGAGHGPQGRLAADTALFIGLNSPGFDLAR